SLPVGPWQEAQVLDFSWPATGLPTGAAAWAGRARANRAAAAMVRMFMSSWPSVAVGRLQAGQVGGDVGDLLVGEALGLGAHGRMLTVTVAVGGQGRHQVLLVLAAHLGHAVAGVGVLVVDDAVAAGAGIEQGLALVGITLGVDGQGSQGKRQAGGGQQDSLHQVVSGSR